MHDAQQLWTGGPSYTPAQRGLRLMFIFTSLLLLVLLVKTAQGHSTAGAYRVRGAAVGPYAVHVWTSPGVLRTGLVHVDAAVMDDQGNTPHHLLVNVRLIPRMAQPMQAKLAGPPEQIYPYPRGAEFWLPEPGDYRLEVYLSDSRGEMGMVSADLRVRTVHWPVSLALAALGLVSIANGLWLLRHSAHFLHTRLPRQERVRSFRPAVPRQIIPKIIWEGEQSMQKVSRAVPRASVDVLAWLNGPAHARVLWGFMLVVVMHWLEHVLQIYQIYSLGWLPSEAGGILGVIYPQLVESEVLHFVYDFIQWSGILLLLSGFQGTARRLWGLAALLQTWHFIEHILLITQYITGHYLFGAVRQTSVLEQWFPRAELHFVYNLVVFVPAVIAVHLYLRQHARRSPAAPARAD